MNAFFQKSQSCFAVAMLSGAFIVGADAALATDSKAALSGAQEVPPVSSAATGSGTITVNSDKSVSGSVTTSGIVGTMAHIHEAPTGKNGPVIIPLSKTSDNVWSVPSGAKLTDAQYQSYKAGDLYVNVHSEAHKDGEIRTQLKP
jgi:hypothetical protein